MGKNEMNSSMKNPRKPLNKNYTLEIGSEGKTRDGGGKG